MPRRIGCLKAHGNPYDNAFVESFIWTLKYEEVYLNEYETFSDALDNIAHHRGRIQQKEAAFCHRYRPHRLREGKGDGDGNGEGGENTETIQKESARTKSIAIEDVRKGHFHNEEQLLVLLEI